jgi:alkylation response protein AidB-like acyl-CoA dehydrogenase
MTQTTIARDCEGGEHELVARARELRPLLSKNSADTDRLRRLPEENVEAMREAGIFRMWQPRRYGGYEADMGTSIDIISELAKGCGSSSWVAALINSCAWLISLFSEEAQDEIYGNDPEARICGVLSPAGVAKPVADGYRLSGSWGFASGCLHSNWATVVAPIVGDDGNLINVGHAAVRMSEVHVKDTWYTVGMRGTGSNTIVADDLFVPEHMMRHLVGPSGAMDAPILNPYPEETVYRVDLGPLASLCLIAPALGLARSMVDLALEQLPRRSIAYTTYQQQTQAVPAQLEIAEALTRLDAAEALIRRAATDADRAATTGNGLDMLGRARVRADVGWATRTFREVAEIVVQMCGASSMGEINHMQQIYRDLQTATLHALLRPSLMLEVYGRVLCGLEPQVSLVL